MVRRIYLDMVRNKLIRGDLPWLARVAARYPLVHLSSLINRPLCGPILGTLVVTYRCNYKCRMCGLPERGTDPVTGGAIEMDTDEMRDLIDQLRAMGVLGVGFTGGEPLIRDDLMTLLEHSAKTGMLTHLNTNGSMLSESVIRDLMRTGIDSLNISVDGAKAETHDRIRGVSGAWESATRAAREFVRIRGQGKKPRLKLVTVVGRSNLEEIPAMVDLAVDLGVECLEYIPEQPFKESKPEDAVAGSAEAARRVEEVFSEALKRARGRLRIENSTRMLKLFGPAFRGEPSPVRCLAVYNSITADCYGQVFPCLPFANWGRPVMRGNGKHLKEVWTCDEYARSRRQLVDCRDCTLNCQAELNLLFQPFLSVK